MTPEERDQVADRIRAGEFGDRWRLHLEHVERRASLSVEELELEYMRRERKKRCPTCGRV